MQVALAWLDSFHLHIYHSAHLFTAICCSRKWMCYILPSELRKCRNVGDSGVDKVKLAAVGR